MAVQLQAGRQAAPVQPAEQEQALAHTRVHAALMQLQRLHLQQLKLGNVIQHVVTAASSTPDLCLLRDVYKPGDRAMAQIIADAPTLPGVPTFLAALMRSSGEAATLGLSILRDIITTRPRDRNAALDVVRCPLCCHSAEAEPAYEQCPNGSQVPAEEPSRPWPHVQWGAEHHLPCM